MNFTNAELTIYSRNTNPTVRVFEEKVRLMEGAEASISFASSMAASGVQADIFYGITTLQLRQDWRLRVRHAGRPPPAFIQIGGK